MPGGAHENMRGWSPEEDELLLQLIQASGKRWKLIAEALGNSNPRTPAMVRNRYLRIERGRMLTEQGKSKNRCGQCGELKRGHVCRVPRAMVTTSFADQEARHEELRRSIEVGGPVDSVMSSDGGPPTPTPSGGSDTSTVKTATLALGAPPLTMPFPQNDTGDASSMMSSPGPLSCGLSLGLSPFGMGMGNTPGGPLSLGGLGSLGGSGLGSLGPGGPPSLGGMPSLRAQNSMDILLQASDLHRIRATTDTPTPLASEFETNPFKLPTMTAAELPIELQADGERPLTKTETPTTKTETTPRDTPRENLSPRVNSPRGCAEAAHAGLAQGGQLHENGPRNGAMAVA